MKKIIGVALAILLTGCATAQYRPIVDIRSDQNAAQYESDLADCQRHAQQINTADSAAGGALIGALLGAAIGVAVGDRGSFARYGAGVGAVDGAAAGGAGAAMTQVQIIRNCIAGRGYVVLDGPTSVPMGATTAIAAPSSGMPTAGTFARVPCDIVKDDQQEQCAKDHAMYEAAAKNE